MATITYELKIKTNRKWYLKQLEDYMNQWLYTLDFAIHQLYFKLLWMMSFMNKNKKEDYLFIQMICLLWAKQLWNYKNEQKRFYKSVKTIDC